MKLVAIARAPAAPEPAAKALAEAAGLAPAEARMRLAREPPALLARLEPEAAEALAAALRGAGLAALALDARVPTDRDRTRAHAFSLGGAGATFAPRSGPPMEVAWPDVLAVLRGARASRLETERTERSRRLSLGKALLTGGLSATRVHERTVRSADESVEQVVLVYARDGRAAVLAEGELDFSGLAPGVQPSSTANMAELARRLREGAKGAFHDDRLLRLGRQALPFVLPGEWRSGAPQAAATRTDTAGTLDVLAEVLRQALLAGLLP